MNLKRYISLLLAVMLFIGMIPYMKKAIGIAVILTAAVAVIFGIQRAIDPLERLRRL